MSQARYIVGDVHDVLRTLPDNSVDLVLTSPPFLALRSYLPADHPMKAKELGSEPTPGAFIDALLDVVEEVRRVLAPHGSLCIELGDTYAGSGGAGGDYGENGLREGQPAFDGAAVRERQLERWKDDRPTSGPLRGGARRRGTGRTVAPAGRGWPQDKSLALVPELFRISLAYGVNPITGRTTEPWRIRNVIRWVRPNPPVGALGDKFRPATSEMVVACPSRTRYFDLDAVREAHKVPEAVYKARPATQNVGAPGHHTDPKNKADGMTSNPAGAPPLDWWAIPTEPYPGSHYATWPRDLLVRPIKAMCPERVCRVCGEPSRRIVESKRTYDPTKVNPSEQALDRDVPGPGRNKRGTSWGMDRAGVGTSYVTLGWTDCNCQDVSRPFPYQPMGFPPPLPRSKWRPGVVLDPFAGSGTTLAVATGHGRDAIGIDLDERNADLALERCGMFLTVEHHNREGVA